MEYTSGASSKSPFSQRRASIAGPFMRNSQASTSVSSNDSSGGLSGDSLSSSGTPPLLSRSSTSRLSGWFDGLFRRNSISDGALAPSTPAPITRQSTSPILTSFGSLARSYAGGETQLEASESAHKLRYSLSSPISGTTSTVTQREADVRQGPLETDLFWLVLRDIGDADSK